MADISTYLAAILSAVYGEDVRGSIHDAIEIINDVSEVVLNTGTAVTGPTSSSTGFYKGSFYINTSTMELWKCIGTNSWQSQGVLKGADGNGISGIEKTGTSGLVDTYTITYDDGDTTTFDVTNGADGQNGSKWYKGTAITGTGTSITGFPAVKDDFYLNSNTGAVYVCTKTGGASVPDPAEWDYVMTLTGGGGGGGSIEVIDGLTSTSSTDALSANQGRVLKGLVDGKADNTSSYTVASSRANIASGDTVSTIFGKIQKWFTDLADLAFISKDGPSSTKYLQGDGTWQAFPTIPTVNDAQLDIQQNGTSKGTFTANASSNATANIITDTFTASVTQLNGKATFDNLDPSYGYDLYYDDNGATGSITVPTWAGTYTKSNGTNTGTIKLAYDITNGTDGTSKWALRILK